MNTRNNARSSDLSYGVDGETNTVVFDELVVMLGDTLVDFYDIN